MKFLNASCTVCCSILIMQMVFCSLPSDSDPVEWKLRVEVPIDHDRYGIKELFPSDLPKGLRLDFGTEDSAGDTITLIKSDTLFYTIDRPLISTDTSKTEKQIGARTLKNAPFIDLQFSFSSNELSPYQGIPLPQPFSVVQSLVESLDGIQLVTFDETSPDLNVTAQNKSQSADLHNVRITLFDKMDTIGWFDTSIISAASSVVFHLPMHDKSIHDTLTVTLRAELPTGAILSQGDGLRVAFSLDNLVVSEAVLMDSMIEYSDTLRGYLTLADSIRIDAIDLENASMYCVMTNPSSFKLQLSGFIENAWKRDYASAKNLLSLQNLSASLDSSKYGGHVIFDTLFKSPSQQKYSKTVTLTDLRLFPSWNADSSTSILEYRYSTKLLPDGRFVRFHKNDTITFMLFPSTFPFIQIRGTFTEKTTERFSSLEKISFEWDPSITDSLKKSFRFSSVRMLFDFTPELPPKSKIDSLHINLTISNPDDPSQLKTLNEKFNNVVPDSLYATEMDITTLMNTWPDSLAFEGELGLPTGTRVVLFNSKDKNGHYKNNFSIGVKALWELKIPLSWHITDTIRMELEQSNFTIETDVLNWFGKLKQSRVELKLNVHNNTNLAFRLFALGANKSYKDELMAFQWVTSRYSRLELKGKSNLVAFTGPDGFELGPRNSNSNLNLELDDKGIGALFSSEGCYIRWFLLMPACSTDILSDTDYIDITARAMIDGVANSDSVLYEKD